MAAPPDAESLESRISEYLKLLPRGRGRSDAAAADAGVLSEGCGRGDSCAQRRVSPQTATSRRHVQDAKLAPEPLRCPPVNTQMQPDVALVDGSVAHTRTVSGP